MCATTTSEVTWLHHSSDGNQILNVTRPRMSHSSKNPDTNCQTNDVLTSASGVQCHPAKQSSRMSTSVVTSTVTSGHLTMSHARVPQSSSVDHPMIDEVNNHVTSHPDGSVTISQESYENFLALSRSETSSVPNNTAMMTELYCSILDLNKRNAAKSNLPRAKVVNFFPESTGIGATPDQILDDPAFYRDFENRSFLFDNQSDSKHEKWLQNLNKEYLEPLEPRKFAVEIDDGKFALHPARFLRSSVECPTKIFNKAALMLQSQPGEPDPTVIQAVSPSIMPVNAYDLSAFGIAFDIPAVVWYKVQKFDKSFKLEDIIKIRFPNKQTINIKQVTMECFYWSMRIFALINKLAFPWDLSLEILEIWLASRSAQTTDNSYRQIALPRTAEAKITLFNSWFNCRATRWQQRRDAPDDTKISNLWDLILTTNGNILASSRELSGSTQSTKKQPKKVDYPKSKQANLKIDPKYNAEKWASLKSQCESSDICFVWNFHNKCNRRWDEASNSCSNKTGTVIRSHKCIKCSQNHRYMTMHAKDLEN